MLPHDASDLPFGVDRQGVFAGFHRRRRGGPFESSAGIAPNDMPKFDAAAKGRLLVYADEITIDRRIPHNCHVQATIFKDAVVAKESGRASRVATG